MLYATANATVPKITVVLRKAYGAGYYVMCGRAYEPDLIVAWPSAEISVMGAEGAVEIIFRKQVEAAEDPVAAKQQLIENFRKIIDVYVAAGNDMIDDVIVIDHVVAGRDVDVDDLAEVLDQLLLGGHRVLGRFDLLAEDDLDRPLGTHDRDLGRGPGDDQIGLVRTAAHHVVAGAVGLAEHDGDLGDGRVRRGIEHLGSVADDPGLLDLGADHEAGHVHQVDEGDSVGVAEVDEPRRLIGGIVVEDAAQLLGLVGHDPGRPAAEAGQAGDDRLGELGLEIE